VLHELLKENEYSDLSESEYSSENVCMWWTYVSYGEEENVSDNRSMQHGIRVKSGAGRPRFPFTGEPGLMLI
jgi:hypothetical protein